MFNTSSSEEPQKTLDGVLFLSCGPGKQVFAIPVQCSSEQPSAPEALVVRPKEPSLLRKLLSCPVRTSTAQQTLSCLEGPSSSCSTTSQLTTPMSALRAALRPKTALQAVLERPPRTVRPSRSFEAPQIPPSPPPISGFPKGSSSPHQKINVVPDTQKPAESQISLFDSPQPCSSGNIIVFHPSSSEESASSSAGTAQPLALPKSEPSAPVSPAAPRFPGKREVSMFGKHDVLRYCIPGETTCYIFSYMRSSHDHDTYRCNECKKKKKHTPVKVIGDDFLSDPCLAPHDCTPVEAIKDKVHRLTYKKFQEIRNDPHYAECLSRQVWEDMLDIYDDKTLGDPDEREEMKATFCGRGFEKRRRTIARNIRVHKNRARTSECMPSTTNDHLPEEDCDLELDVTRCMPTINYEHLINGDCSLEDMNLRPFEHLMYGEEEDEYQQIDHPHTKRTLEGTLEENEHSSPHHMYYVKRIKHDDEVTA